MIRSAVIGSIVVLLSASGQVSADEVIKNRVAADTAEKFQAVAEEVRNEMGTGGRYEFITRDDKAKVDSDLAAMSAMLQKYGSVAAMTQLEKVQLFNTQEQLNGVLTHSDRNRLVCEHKAPLGTTIARTTCQTVADIEQNRKDGQHAIYEAGAIGSVCVHHCRSD
jgi:hypothetical protein